MEHLFKILLYTHIAGGGISLLKGLIVMLLEKGNKRHKTIGNIYFYAMIVTAFVALPMSYLHPNYFLFIIGIFTIYVLLTGKRYLLKRFNPKISITDWTITISMGIIGTTFFLLGLFNLYYNNSFGVVFIFFSFISLFLVYQDIKNYNGENKIKNFWLTTHLQRMVGGYIASATGFLVVNNTILPGFIAWTSPTFLLVPVLLYWTRKHKMEKIEEEKNSI